MSKSRTLPGRPTPARSTVVRSSAAAIVPAMSWPKQLARLRPANADALDRLIRSWLKLRVPRSPIIKGHDAPFDYLLHTFFEQPGDLVVWANRGGGKTMLGAAATLLDMLFKPGIEIRILGGSMEQSQKMHSYLKQMIEALPLRSLLDGPITARRIRFRNGSSVELLSQSHRSVRGVRVHKIRCDEVDEFDPEVWQAVQMVTRSGHCGATFVQGKVEAMSTLHRPFGLMSQLATPARAADATQSQRKRVLRWSALDVIERCAPERDCDSCVLLQDCQRRAKEADGFITVDDLVQQRLRTSHATWQSEMLCQRPQRSDCVYPMFDPAVHVVDRPVEVGGTNLIGGMDFGLRSPLVMLWAVITFEAWQPGTLQPISGDASGDAGHLADATGGDGLPQIYVIDEYVQADLPLPEHLDRIAAQGTPSRWPTPAWIGVDPAGRQRSAHTGLSDIDLLRQRGQVVRTLPSPIRMGIDRIRHRLETQRLCVHPRCRRLIEALTQYHFDARHPHRTDPVKDGPDHVCDALRYMVMNLDGSGGPVRRRAYW